jgi:hypothetical protein
MERIPVIAREQMNGKFEWCNHLNQMECLNRPVPTKNAVKYKVKGEARLIGMF